MVANAGICRGFSSVIDSKFHITLSLLHRIDSLLLATSEDWDLHYKINVKSTFLCYKYAAIQMVSQGRGGRIIGACSLVGKKGMHTSKAGCCQVFINSCIQEHL